MRFIRCHDRKLLSDMWHSGMKSKIQQKLKYLNYLSLQYSICYYQEHTYFSLPSFLRVSIASSCAPSCSWGVCSIVLIYFLCELWEYRLSLCYSSSSSFFCTLHISLEFHSNKECFPSFLLELNFVSFLLCILELYSFLVLLKYTNWVLKQFVDTVLP